ncbi:hypothetical protein LTR54_006841 [Friedmanniomyces endolithicus]|uniref:Uncharacterized protein n=1 Tax=Friedmanniomyces endolithicus TaxID=329885 RepID=A0AAN6FSC1_9PEZI|nr:hypothetical protein LTR82_005334 [Friedmanniomyces endolithicus]KAK1006317.1 hypothetical protein LTR54_006841 [Friedmanniomyces endolithicus]
MSFDSLRHGNQMSALEFLRDKPLPSVPSPTLTNPDMVLPSFDGDVHASLPSPARTMKRTPSLNFFRDRMAEQQNARTPVPKKEKRGLMSRKMLLLRSRTGSGMTVNGGQQQQPAPRSVPSDSDTFSTYNSNYASSPTLMDVGNLAPEQVNEKRLSFGGSSFNSEDYAVIPAFLAKYEATDGTTTDDEMFDSDSPAPKRYGYSVTIEGGLDAQRRQQEEAEHKSAMLSSRAEQILANAKKRLNLMEGNLRGARDLVAPLTHANLKRATSLGSSHHTSYAGRVGFGGYGAESPVRQYPVRPLTAQASSPTMGRDYIGHARGFSGTELPERPQTAFSKSHSMTRSGRIPVKANDGSWTQSLRSSQSHDSLGSSGAHRERPLHAKGSPDSNLEPLAEDEASHRATSPRNSIGEDDRHNALRIQRPPSRTDDLREQMTSLKGRISTLRDRAREDSLRRQSLQNLRTPSPFSNSAASPPEYFYTQSPSYGSPVLDTNAGIGRVSADNSPEKPQTPPETWEAGHTLSGSRNAFAQQAAAQRRRSDDAASPGRAVKSVVPRKPLPEAATSTQGQHKRTQGGTMMVQPAADRYAHHQHSRSRDMPGAYTEDKVEAPASPGAYADEDGGSSLPLHDTLTPGYDHAVSDAGDEENASVYQDAVDDSPPVVAHEDRSDAFDYENFFLHSAMATYGTGDSNSHRRGSNSSAETTTSVATARGPAVPTEDHDFDFDPSSALYPPPTPETPERLKEIERSLVHRRTLSDDSVSTFATFATADEGRLSPFDRSRQPSALDWPTPPSETAVSARPTSTSRPGSSSRPSTAIKRAPIPGSGPAPVATTAARQRDASSERADSGVGLPKRASSGGGLARPKTKIKTAGPIVASPPLSPRTTTAALQNSQTYPHDPAKVVVNALLDPLGKGLGLKDKAVLFGLVENLRRVVAGLQQEDPWDGQADARVLRIRLEDAAAVLGGEV